MDSRLLHYYQQELDHLRELGGEFVERYPFTKGLGLEAFKRGAPADPYVERLLEGVAFLAARVQLKIDAEFPRFTDQLLEMVYPHYLAPLPSMAVVQLMADEQKGVFADGFEVPRDTILRAEPLPGEQSVCEYRTAHALTLWPLELVGLRHSAALQDLSSLQLDTTRPVRGTLRLRLRTQAGVPLHALALDRLPLFVRGHQALGARLYELLLAGGLGWTLRATSGEPQWSTPQPATSIAAYGFDDEQALLPYVAKSFGGYRLLQEYFALPQRFSFVELRQLNQALRSCQGTELELAVFLDRHDPEVERDLAARFESGQKGPAPLELHCTPAINLFRKNVDRVRLSAYTHEQEVVADRARPLDFEVHSLLSVRGYAADSRPVVEFKPFYSSSYARSETNGEADGDAYYTIQRRPRARAVQRSDYGGTDLFIALVDGQHGPYRRELKQLGIEACCTNRDLPLGLLQRIGRGETDFVVHSGAPVSSCRCVAGPSPPRASLAFGESSWRLISQLSLNYLSLASATAAPASAASGPAAGEPDNAAAAALRELLRLYVPARDAAALHSISGLLSATSSGAVRRIVSSDGLVGFARGLELTLRCDESAFQGGSAFLFGSVLERFFARYVSINSFVETVLHSQQRGEIARWAARSGDRRPL